MRQYAVTDGCRRALLLDYFGQTSHADACGACDNCRTGRSAETRHAEAVAETVEVPFPVGSGARLRFVHDSLMAPFQS